MEQNSDITLMCGDCLELIKSIPDGSTDEWIRVPSHEDYAINRNGEVIFLGRTQIFKNGQKRQCPPRICNRTASSSGYFVSLDGMRKSIALMVAKIFIPNPMGYKRVYYKDEDVLNPLVSNLDWGTRQDVIFNDTHRYCERLWLMDNYNVSTDGCVSRKSDGKVLSSTDGAKGYKVIRLKAPPFSKNKDRRKPYKIHRLVAMFYLDDYSDDLQVNHINGIKHDNRIENLEMVTASQNACHAWRALDSANRRRMTSERRRNSGRPVRCIESGIEYRSASEAARVYGVSRCYIDTQLKGIVKNPRRNLHFEYADKDSNHVN